MAKTNDTASWWRHQLAARPVWMQPLMLFCIYMALIYMPWDIFVKPVAEDQEVWFGYMFTGCGQSNRAVALDCLRSRCLGFLAYEVLDVAMGGTLLRADCHWHGSLDIALSERSSRVCGCYCWSVVLCVSLGLAQGET